MIDLRKKVENIIESEYNSHITSMLEADYLYPDAFVYYQSDILSDFEEFIERKLNQNEIDKIADYLLFWNPEENIEYQRNGFYYGHSGKFPIVGNMGEIEIDLTPWFANPLKQSAIDAINRYTDLYISDSGMGYIPIDYDTITLKNDNDTLMEALLYPLHEIGEFLPFDISWHIKETARGNTL